MPFCVDCQRPTTVKKGLLTSQLDYFFICGECNQIWCISCYSAKYGRSTGYLYRKGKKGKIKCIYCNLILRFLKLPKDVGFQQVPPTNNPNAHQQINQNITVNIPNSKPSKGEERKTNFCHLCGMIIPADAKFCQHCGGNV